MNSIMTMYLNEYSVKNFIEKRYELGTKHFTEIVGIFDENIYANFKRETKKDFIKEVLQGEPESNESDVVESKMITIDEAFLDKKTKLENKKNEQNTDEQTKTDEQTNTDEQPKKEVQQVTDNLLDEIYTELSSEILNKDKKESKNKKKKNSKNDTEKASDTFKYENKEILNPPGDSKKITISLDALEE
jgi:hypothetical protein